MQISITHVPTNNINIYTSFRKAVLYFAPEIKTTGQTLATYADSGKLFKDEYKIERINSKQGGSDGMEKEDTFNLDILTKDQNEKNKK